MTSLVLSPNASGSGSLTIAAPNTASNITFNLPTTIGNAGTSAVVTTDASGNLGIGVTPSAWRSGALSYDVARSSYADENGTLTIASNAYRATSNWIYKVSTFATRMDSDSGQFRWYTAPSGTAGNAISFTQAMTLDASGNLGVGATSPAYKLDVVSTAMRIASGTTGVGYVQYGNSATATNNWHVGTEGDGTYRFYNGNFGSGTERTRITSDGNFYVNTTGAGGKVYVVSDLTSNNGLRVDTPASFTSNSIALICGTAAGTGWNFLYGESSGGSFRIQIRGDGNVYNANGTYGTISDARLKQDIVDAGSQWADIKAIRFRKYRMKSDVDVNPNAPVLLGVVAQELEQVCPGLVDDGETKSVKSSVLLMKAAVALQEAMTRIEQLESTVTALTARVAALEAQP